MTLGELLEILGAAACATDSGRPRCPLCGRWARPEDVGQIGGRFESPNGVDNDCDGGIDVDSKTDGKRRCGRPGRDWSKVPLGQKPERDIAAELGVPLGTVLTALRRRAITRYRPEPEA
ncbi:MAG: hypothetical protein Q8Q14_15515, partial [Gemmatimonadales bacterium]|nr:hypothetical protein [Gemmatimonadales bacterium]